MDVGTFFLRIASSAAGQWVAGLFRKWGWKRQGAQEASSKSLEQALEDAKDAQEVSDIVAGLSHSDVIDYLRSKYPGRYNK